MDPVSLMAIVPVALCNWPTVTSLSVTACPVVVAGSARPGVGHAASAATVTILKPTFAALTVGLELDFCIGSPVLVNDGEWGAGARGAQSPRAVRARLGVGGRLTVGRSERILLLRSARIHRSVSAATIG